MEFRRRRLHAEGQLVAGRAAVDFRVADQQGALAVEVGKGVEAGTADIASQAGRVGEIGDGFAARAIMADWCDNDPARIKSFDVRFAAPFFPGETLVTRSWKDGTVVSFECEAAERGATIFRNGRCEISE